MFDSSIFSWDAAILTLIAFYLLRKYLRRRQWISVPAAAIYVIDGDTFSVQLGSGSRVSIRPTGFDAPEIDQPGGKLAASYLRNLAKRGFLVREIEADIYGRTIANVRIGEDGKGGDLARHMLRAGLAHSVSESAIIRLAQTFVPRLAGRGIWKNSLLGLRLTHPQVHRAARTWAGRVRGR